jgi:hypothetical protein
VVVVPVVVDILADLQETSVLVQLLLMVALVLHLAHLGVEEQVQPLVDLGVQGEELLDQNCKVALVKLLKVGQEAQQKVVVAAAADGMAAAVAPNILVVLRKLVVEEVVVVIIFHHIQKLLQLL